MKLSVASCLLASGVFAGTLNDLEELRMLSDSCDGAAVCEDMVAALDPLGRSGASEEEIAGFRRLKNLKALIIWLQPEHRFARYCFYGCYCLPDETHNLYTLGYGKPVDPVDNSCRNLDQCYECAKMDHEPLGRECDASRVQYNYDLEFDDDEPNNHMLKSIVCTDEPTDGVKKSCRRAVCECDRALAYSLRENYGFWQEGHHQEQGGFNATAECMHTGGDGGAGGEFTCCGTSTRFPFKTMGGARGCCGDKTYDTGTMSCCDGNTLASFGMC